MTGQSIQQVSPNSGALSKEHYQTFEMAKANDTILGGNDLQQIRSYAAFTRAQAQAMHKTIASMSDVEDVMASKAEMTETAQTFAKVSVYADQRIGEILRELPTRAGQRTDTTSSVASDKVTKQQAIKDAGIERSQAYDLQAMAANPEVVEAVIAKAEQDGRVVSRAQVLRAIKEKERAESELEAVNDDLKQAWQAQEDAEAEVIMLQRKLESIEHPKPEVVTREVVREVESEESKRRVHELEHLERIHSDDNQKLRKQNQELQKKLDRAKVLLEEKGYEDNASWDISALTTATNQYLRQYGGKLWAFDQFYRVDEVTQQEFERAITNLAAFSQNVMQMIQDKNKLEA